jgi:hypothetical protein
MVACLDVGALQLLPQGGSCMGLWPIGETAAPAARAWYEEESRVLHKAGSDEPGR